MTIKVLEDIYVQLVDVQTKLYQQYKDSDENTSVHLTILQQDVESALVVLEDLLGKE